MRLKTLGVFMVTALALFTAFFWLTDAGRRETIGHGQEEQLLEYGLELFGPPTSEVPFTANCAQCHGPDGRGGAHTFMPHIDSLTRRDYIEFIPDGYLFTVIAEGGEAVGKSDMMPAWKATLSEQDIKDIIAHIRSLPTY
jgi:cytochrome c oxidase cbb3-type subunit 3